MCDGDGTNRKSTLSLKTKLLFLIERGLSSRELLSALAIAKANLAALTKELAADGLVEKTRDSRDRREKRYALTAEGERVLAEKKKIIEENFAEAAAGKEEEVGELIYELVGLLGSAGASGEDR